MAAIRILHIADIHGSKEIKIPSPEVSIHTNLEDHETGLSIFNKAIENISRNVEKFDGRINSIVIAGDLVAPDEAKNDFDAVLREIDSLRASLYLEKHDIIVVPGNHEVDWNADQNEELAFFQENVKKWGFVSPYGSVNLNHWTCPTPRVEIWPLSSPTVTVPWGRIPEASRILENVKKGLLEEKMKDLDRVLEILDPFVKTKLSIGMIGRGQMDKLKSNLPERPEREEVLRIAVLHHAPTSASSEHELDEYHSLLDAGFFIRRLWDLGFRIVIHGHTHRGDPHWISDMDERCHLLVVPTMCISSAWHMLSVEQDHPAASVRARLHTCYRPTEGELESRITPVVVRRGQPKRLILSVRFTETTRYLFEPIIHDKSVQGDLVGSPAFKRLNYEELKIDNSEALDPDWLLSKGYVPSLRSDPNAWHMFIGIVPVPLLLRSIIAWKRSPQRYVAGCFRIVGLMMCNKVFLVKLRESQDPKSILSYLCSKGTKDVIVRGETCDTTLIAAAWLRQKDIKFSLGTGKPSHPVKVLLKPIPGEYLRQIEKSKKVGVVFGSDFEWLKNSYNKNKKKELMITQIDKPDKPFTRWMPICCGYFFDHPVEWDGDWKHPHIEWAKHLTAEHAKLARELMHMAQKKMPRTSQGKVFQIKRGFHPGTLSKHDFDAFLTGSASLKDSKGDLIKALQECSNDDIAKCFFGDHLVSLVKSEAQQLIERLNEAIDNTEPLSETVGPIFFGTEERP